MPTNNSTDNSKSKSQQRREEAQTKPNADATSAEQETAHRAHQDTDGQHNDTRLDESQKAGETGSKAPAADGSAGTQANNAVDTPSAAPTSGVNGNQEVTPGSDPNVPGAHQGNQPDAPNANASKNHVAGDGSDAKTDAKDQQRTDSDTSNETDTSSEGHADQSAVDDAEQNSASEADKANAADKEAGNKVDSKEKARRKEAATDPNKSVTDPNFNPDGKTTNPDNPAHTLQLDSPAPLEGDTVTVDEANEAGAPLGANTTDTDLPDSKSDILAAAKQRVKEQNPALQKADPAAYKEAVRRAILDLTNGDPDASAVVTKHWDNQAVAAVSEA